jgi:NTE family protein
VAHKIKLLIGDVLIEDLNIKYTAVATDLSSQKIIYFTKGKLIDAIRASVAMPTIFTPVNKDEMILVDGGVLNPLPINVVTSDDTDIKIAVNLDANIKNKYIVDIPKEQSLREDVLNNQLNKLLNKAESLVPQELVKIAKEYQEKYMENSDRKKQTSRQDIAFIFSKTLDTAQSVLSKYTIQNQEVDILIQIPRSSCEFYEFTKAYKMINIGKMAAYNDL